MSQRKAPAETTCREMRVVYRSGSRVALNVPLVAFEDADAFLRRTVRLHEETQETFVAVYCDSKNRPIRWRRIASGTPTQVAMDVRLVLVGALAIEGSAPIDGILVAHNHPAGDFTPSDADRAISARLREACRIVGFRLLDHVVVGEHDSASALEDA